MVNLVQPILAAISTLTLFQVLTLAGMVASVAIAVTGFVLQLRKGRPRISVRSAFAFGHPNPALELAVVVANKGDVAATVSYLGFLYKGAGQHGHVTAPAPADAGPWPRRLEPNSSVTLYCAKPASRFGAHRLTGVFVRTQCGRHATSFGKALRQLSREG